MRRWKVGMMKISPEDLLQSELVGYAGAIIACIASAIFFFFMKNMWPIALLMCFTGWIQLMQAIAKWQQWQTMKNLKGQMAELSSLLITDKREDKNV